MDAPKTRFENPFLPSFLYLLVLIAGVSLGLLGWIVPAAAIADGPRDKAIGPPGDSGVDRVVVLKNGNVFTGHVLRKADQVVVSSPTSQVVFDRDDVDYVAKTLLAAYEARRKRLPSRNASAQEKLMHWCCANELWRQAQYHLDAVVALTPQNKSIASWQNRIHQKLTPSNSLPAKQPKHPDSQRAEQLGNALSPRSQLDFVRHIQPILFNRCAQGSCHGRGAKNNYQLLAGRGAVSRNVTQRNLGATLKKLDARPELSMLWMSAVEPHGDSQQRIRRNMRDLNTSEQEKLLNWLRIVCRELNSHEDIGTTGQPDALVVRLPSTEPTPDPFDPAGFNSLQTSD